MLGKSSHTRLVLLLLFVWVSLTGIAQNKPDILKPLYTYYTLSVGKSYLPTLDLSNNFGLAYERFRPENTRSLYTSYALELLNHDRFQQVSFQVSHAPTEKLSWDIQSIRVLAFGYAGIGMKGQKGKSGADLNLMSGIGTHAWLIEKKKWNAKASLFFGVILADRIQPSTNGLSLKFTLSFGLNTHRNIKKIKPISHPNF